MKKQDLFKFSLTAVCLAVLSACGSSGGGKPTITTTPTTNNTSSTAAQDAAAKEAAAEKAAADAAAKAAADKAAKDLAAAQKAAADAQKAAADAQAAAAAAAKKAADDLAAAKAAAQKAQDEAVKKAAEEAAKKALADKEVADKAAAEKAKAEAAAKKAADDAAKAANDAVNKANALGNKDRLTAEPDVSVSNSFVGYKHVVKNDSNLITNESKETDSRSSTPTPMRVQTPNVSLDNIVVAEPVQTESGAPRVYLEDFDTRFANKVSFTAANKNAYGADFEDKVKKNGSVGNTGLAHLYINSKTNGKADNSEIEKQREALGNAVSKITEQIRVINGKIRENTIKVGIDENSGLRKLATTAKELAEAGDQKAQAQVEVYSKQINEINTDIEKLEKEKFQLEQKQTAAEVKKAEFDALNPEPSTAEKNAARALTADRDQDAGKNYPTKTTTMGKQDGGIWVFSLADIQTKHQNFTESSSKNLPDTHKVKRGFEYKGKDADGNVVVGDPIIVEAAIYSDATANGSPAKKTALSSRNLDHTVAEIYGVRTKAYGSFTKPFDVMDQPTENGGKDTPANNLPLVNEYLGDRLKNVQYGRVTSALHGRDALESYKEGVVEQNGSINTYVASFGNYGKENTENHYFYRGLNNVGKEELKALKADTKNGIITYEGHAVAYGLNNNYRGNIPIPTALGARVGFVSGNHARAEVNLGTNEVTGYIYNKWIDSVRSPKDLLNVPLVDFKGVIAENGNIAGTAIKADDKSTGLFGATLYGKGAEIGGTVASDDKGDKKWGAVFGGIREVVPTKPVLPGVADGTDGKN